MAILVLMQAYIYIFVITSRNSSCGKVMFSQAYVILSVGGGVSQHAMGQGLRIPACNWAKACDQERVCVTRDQGRCVAGGCVTRDVCEQRVCDREVWPQLRATIGRYASYWNAFFFST